MGLPGTEATVRGFSAVSLLLIDEAARVEDAMYKSLRPMLAVGDGRFVADEHAVREARILLRSVGAWRRGVGAAFGAGDGVSADSGGVSGGGAAGAGEYVVRAGVSVRVRG